MTDHCPEVQKASRNTAYNALDRYLRNSLDDEAYAEMSQHLETLYVGVSPEAGTMTLSLDEVREALTNATADFSTPDFGEGQAQFEDSQSPALSSFIDRVSLHGEYSAKELAFLRTEGIRNANFLVARKSKETIDSLIQDLKLKDQEIANLRATKFARFGNEDCWIYQGDGEDHLEGLVCPVVISAETLLSLQTQASFPNRIREAVAAANEVLLNISRELPKTMGTPDLRLIDEDVQQASAHLETVLPLLNSGASANCSETLAKALAKAYQAHPKDPVAAIRYLEKLAGM